MMSTSVHVVSEVGQADVVVVVEESSSTLQPTMTLLVERTWVAVVAVADTPNDVVVIWMVADCVSHDVGSDEYEGTLSFPILHHLASLLLASQILSFTHAAILLRR